jgi:hypothetical protein
LIRKQQRTRKRTERGLKHVLHQNIFFTFQALEKQNPKHHLLLPPISSLESLLLFFKTYDCTLHQCNQTQIFPQKTRLAYPSTLPKKINETPTQKTICENEDLLSSLLSIVFCACMSTEIPLVEEASRVRDVVCDLFGNEEVFVNRKRSGVA